MEWFEFLKWGAYVVSGVVGWFVKVLWDAQKEMREDLKRVELNLSDNYTKKTDFRDAIAELKDEFREMTQPLFRKLDRIEDYLLNKKVD